MKIVLGHFKEKARRENILNRQLGMRGYIGIIMVLE